VQCLLLICNSPQLGSFAVTYKVNIISAYYVEITAKYGRPIGDFKKILRLFTVSFYAQRLYSYGYQHPAAEKSVPYHLDTPLSFVSRHPCVWYAGHSRGEANKRLTDSKHGTTGGILSRSQYCRVVDSLDSPKSRNSFPGIKRKDQDS